MAPPLHLSSHFLNNLFVYLFLCFKQAHRDKEAALETLADREQTIGKFREVVQKLQEQCQDLQAQLEQESARPVSKLPEMLDFKKMFAESKAHTRAIDLELRRIEVQESNQHVQYLTAFMPDSFMSRGGIAKFIFLNIF